MLLMSVNNSTTVLLVEQELVTVSECISCHSVFSGVRVVRCLVFCVVVCSVCPFVLFLLTIAVSVRLPFTALITTFGIIKLFLIAYSLTTIWLSSHTLLQIKNATYVNKKVIHLLVTVIRNSKTFKRSICKAFILYVNLQLIHF